MLPALSVVCAKLASALAPSISLDKRKYSSTWLVIAEEVPLCKDPEQWKDFMSFQGYIMENCEKQR